MKEVEYKNGSIYFTDTGKGRVVVLLHGFLGSHEIWEDISSHLSRFFRVICIDLPGHGKSDCFGYLHSMDLLAGSVKAVMESLKLKRYVIIGHSMGGYTGLSFAEHYFENLKGLCLFHSTAWADSETKKNDRNRAIRAVKSNHNIYVRETIPNLFSALHAGEHQHKIKFAQKIASSVPRRGILNSLEGMKSRPHRDFILHYAQYPIMMVIGRHDKVLPVDDLLEQADLIKDKMVLLLEQSGHMGFLEEEALTLKFLKRFIRYCFSSPAARKRRQ